MISSACYWGVLKVRTIITSECGRNMKLGTVLHGIFNCKKLLWAFTKDSIKKPVLNQRQRVKTQLKDT